MLVMYRLLQILNIYTLVVEKEKIPESQNISDSAYKWRKY